MIHIRRGAALMSVGMAVCGIVATQGATGGAPEAMLQRLSQIEPQLAAQPQAGAPPQVTPQSVPETGPPEAEPPELRDPRFAFYRVDETFLRLDLHTGEVASCSRQPAGWVCAMASDERAVVGLEIARLQRDNAVLKKVLLERGLPLPEGMASAVAAQPGEPAAPRPPQSVPPVASASSGPTPTSRATRPRSTGS